MDNKNNPSWVRNRVHLGFSPNPIMAKFEVSTEWSLIYLNPDVLADTFREFTLGGMKLGEVIPEAQLSAMAEYASEGIFWQSVDNEIASWIANDYDEDHFQKLEHGEVTVIVEPIMWSANNIATDKQTDGIQYMILTDIPGLIDRRNVTHFNRELGGLYCDMCDIAWVDISRDDHIPVSASHETDHLLIRKLLDEVKLRDAMYGEDAAIRIEEICVHFFTDCHVIADAKYDFFRKAKISRNDAGKITSVTLPKIQVHYDETVSDGSADSFEITMGKSACDFKMVSKNNQRNNTTLSNSSKPAAQTRDLICRILRSKNVSDIDVLLGPISSSSKARKQHRLRRSLI